MTRHNRLQRLRGAFSLTGGLVALALALASPAVAQPVRTMGKHAQTKQVTTRTEPGRFIQTTKITVAARVLGLDRTYRTIGLKPDDQDSFDVVAGPDIRNLDQLNPGDRVEAVYLETITLQLRKAGAPKPAPADEKLVRSAQPGGANTGGVVAKKAGGTADVVALEPSVRRVTLRGPSGEKLRLLVKDQVQFDNIKVGDHVDVTYAQAMAIALNPIR